MSNIEWCDRTDNVFVVMDDEGKPHGHYCEHVSDGCVNCYAERLNMNPFFKGNGLPYRRTKQRPLFMMREDVMQKWVRARKPCKIFVNSMTDTFGRWWPVGFITTMFNYMLKAPKHQTFLLLTKRPFFAWLTAKVILRERGWGQLPDNIFIGCSVENQKWADNRYVDMDILSQYARTFVSYEPAIGPVDWKNWHFIEWMISGGESGTKKQNIRPSHPQWHRDTRDWCEANDVAYFFKQWGVYVPTNDGDHDAFLGLSGVRGLTPFNWRPGLYPHFATMKWVGKKAAGRLLDGRYYSAFPKGVA